MLQPLDSMIADWNAVVCHENGEEQIGVALSQGFFAFSPGHPILFKAMTLSHDAVLNTNDVNMRIGPRFF